MQWHPDNFQDEEEKKKAEKKFIDIAAAKEVLTDPGMWACSLFWDLFVLKTIEPTQPTCFAFHLYLKSRSSLHCGRVANAAVSRPQLAQC